MLKNIFTYWDGQKPQVIQELENILEHKCFLGGYILHRLNKKSIREYIDFPDSVFELKHFIDQTDFLRVKLLNQYGGIWLDSDVLVRKNLDEFFNILEKKEGFFISFPTRQRIGCNNAILGAQPQTEFYKEWEKQNNLFLEEKSYIGKTLAFGNYFLRHNVWGNLAKDFHIFHGYKTKMELFANLSSKRLLANDDGSDILEADPPLIHFFHRNYWKYEQLEESEKQKTLLYKLIQNTKNNDQ